MACFRPVPDSEVDPLLWLLVHHHARAACEELGIGMPSFVFLERDPGGIIEHRDDQAAWALGTRIEIPVDTPTARLREVVRHEVKHAHQHLNPNLVKHADSEADAEAFARQPGALVTLSRRGIETNNFSISRLLI